MARSVNDVAMTDCTVYRYRAARSDGSIDTGVVEAATQAAAAAVLAQRGLFPFEMGANAGSSARRPAMSTADLALGLRVLADLLDAGLPMTHALLTFEELSPNSWRRALPAIRERVREGRSLAAALSDAPVEIPSATIGIIKAGEAGSGLVPAVRRSAELAEARAAMQRALQSAIAYPLVVAAAGVGSVGVLIGVVLPRFAAVLADLGQALPTSTRLVIGTAATIRQLALPGSVALLLAVVVWRMWTATEEGRAHWHRLLLTTPGLCRVRHAAATAKLAASLSALLESGVPVASAMYFAGRASGDGEVNKRTIAAREQISSGHTLAQAFASTQAVTETALRLVRA
jgi:general secretion pathway protein F